MLVVPDDAGVGKERDTQVRSAQVAVVVAAAAVGSQERQKGHEVRGDDEEGVDRASRYCYRSPASMVLVMVVVE